VPVVCVTVVFSCSDRKLLADAATNKPSTSASGGSERRKDVPVVPFGTDLLDWGEDFEVPIIARYTTHVH